MNNKKLQSTNFNLQSNKAFTLIELMLYMGIASIILLTTSVLFASLITGKVKNQSIAEVEQQGGQIIQIVTQSIRNSDTISAPAPGSSSATLSLTFTDPLKNPTIFSFSGGNLQVQEAGGSQILLNNSKVAISNLTFYNYSAPNTAGTIRIIFTISRINSSGRNEYDFTKTFYGSASLR